ncbi:hypothetical protein [Mesorhizobium sp. M0152]|uniref:hypothetical protein n=1 Tax=Mesorhizobium sp. M0152 TaxID=2956898 RepID=UPI00333DE5A1
MDLPHDADVLRLGRTREALDQNIVSGQADMTAIGRWALANPDLIERLWLGASFNESNPATFYGGGAAGYTDYPRLAD